jgi:hypothetical protein
MEGRALTARRPDIGRMEAAQARAVTRIIHNTIVAAFELYPELDIEEVCALCLVANAGDIAHELKEARLRVIREIRIRITECD